MSSAREEGKKIKLIIVINTGIHSSAGTLEASLQTSVQRCYEVVGQLIEESVFAKYEVDVNFSLLSVENIGKGIQASKKVRATLSNKVVYDHSSSTSSASSQNKALSDNEEFKGFLLLISQVSILPVNKYSKSY